LGRLLGNYLLNCTYCELFTEGNIGYGMDIVYIRKSVDVRVYTGYVLTEQDGYMNMGQY